MDPNVFLGLMSLMIPFFIAIGAYQTAKKKHRTPWLWFINCFSTGLLGLIVIWCSRTLDYDEELDYNEESDVLGWVMLPVAIIWFIITFYYGYYSVKSHHDAMVFDAMMQFMR